MDADESTLRQVPGIGPSTAEEIRAFFAEKHNREVIASLLRAGVRPAAAPRRKAAALSGKTFVLTGTLQSMTRDDAKNRLAALGAKTSDSVSRRTDYVVVGTEPGSKADRARELGIPALREPEFLKLIGEPA